MMNRIRGAAKARSTSTLIPALLVSSALLLTACGDGGTDEPAAAAPESSSQPSESPSTATLADGYEAPADEMDAELKMYFGPPGNLNDDFGADPAGPQTYESDPAPRATTYKEYMSKRDGVDAVGFTNIFNEVVHDAEYSARNVSGFLEGNPGATLADIQAEDGLLVNRYENIGTMEVRQDEHTGFFFVITNTNDKDAFMPTVAGALVEQVGITPDYYGLQEAAG